MDPYALAGLGIGILFSIIVIVYPDRKWLFDRRYGWWVVLSFLIGIGVSITMAVLPPERAAPPRWPRTPDLTAANSWISSKTWDSSKKKLPKP